jgi:hypothetical protein
MLHCSCGTGFSRQDVGDHAPTINGARLAYSRLKPVPQDAVVAYSRLKPVPQDAVVAYFRLKPVPL